VRAVIHAIFGRQRHCKRKWWLIMASGIKDKVAIIGMGCTQFGERWDVGTPELLAEAFEEALKDAGIERSQVNAVWSGSALDSVNVGNSAIPTAQALRLNNIPISRVENMCATGTEALRSAAYAVASGAVDIALAIGAEKLKDTGYGGLPSPYKGTLNDLWLPLVSAPAGFAQLAAGYRAKYNVNKDDLKRAMAHVSWKSHQNGVMSPKAHLRKAITMEQILGARIIAEPLGLFDCCGVSDGAAAAIVTTPEIARGLGKKDLVTIKAIQLSVSTGVETSMNQWDGSYVATTRNAAQRAYTEAGVRDPGAELSLMEVHDCFSITELVTMEDLLVSESGHAVQDVMDGRFDRDGDLPCQVDGGLKCFGHPVAASGLRMAYEVYLQLQGRAAARQLTRPSLGLTHNLGGVPYLGVAAVSIFGLFQ
jgi:acetyl-CoA C-acetyltransferase